MTRPWLRLVTGTMTPAPLAPGGRGGRSLDEDLIDAAREWARCVDEVGLRPDTSTVGRATLRLMDAVHDWEYRAARR